MANSLDLDQDQQNVGPDLGSNRLQRLSADDKSPLAMKELLRNQNESAISRDLIHKNFQALCSTKIVMIDTLPFPSIHDNWRLLSHLLNVLWIHILEYMQQTL